MSLFGDEAAAPSSSLFDEPSTPSRRKHDNNNNNNNSTNTSSSIFADSAAADEADDTPWGFTPKRNAGRGSVVKTLLADADVPDLYIDTFDDLQQGDQVAAEDARKLLADSGVAAADQDKIGTIVSNNGEASRLGRGELNVLLALIGLAQEGEELGLDAVDERRRKLPIPKLSAQKAPRMAQPAVSQPEAQGGAQGSSEQPRTSGARKPSFGLDSDPWASPEMHKGHKHLNGSHGFGASQRTTSNFTTTSTEPAGTNGSYDAAGSAPTNESSGSWGASNNFAATSTSGFGAADGPPGSAGFGDEGNGPNKPATRRPQQVRVSTGAEESVTVNNLDEKEGMFLFQHRNYEVASIRRNSKVIRRYSDFVWLLDCLHKRYPFRQLPLLPPKRVAINGNHLAADTTFVEKRRRGLARFANALVRHPVLRDEQLVVMFLTVPTELAVWRKQATISVQEEFVGRSLPPSLEDSLPQNLADTFDTVRGGVRRSAELYINLCNLVERLIKRKEGIAAEYSRLSLNFISVTEVSNDTYAIDSSDVPVLNEGINSTAKHLSTSQALLEDESRAWDEGVLEDLKTLRDALVSMRDMFDRRDRYAKDNIPSLERRIQANEAKLSGIHAKGDSAKPGEADKVANAITADKQSIVNQHARSVFIKECVRDEILHFQSTQWRISRLHQDWAQERVKYAELQADNFRGLVDAVEGMPTGE
ncbi:putative AH/BAR domain superfamily, sorting nexin-8/Mvp1, PX domain superfamily [Septoria linicola]|nr:putative AH/BAR domain superfamily, sorting nexin-8/Mvp1, PX domain superfamily [Septoria linicola]